MKPIYTGLSIMLENEFLQATLPLFQEEIIDVIEWSFDILNNTHRPPWHKNLLTEYGNQNRLLGHGVYYSLFDASWGNRQDNWLLNLKNELKSYNYTHITEHFGFMSSSNYHEGVPLPISLNSTTLNIGSDRLKRIQDIAQLPVGVENLAFSFCEKDVLEQGIFLDKLTDAVDGFIILDLHNIYCQAHNFEIDLIDLIDLYPLEKVREIHISGGSWQDSIYSKSKKIRRDTHDDDVPEIIFDVLPTVIRKCTNLEFIILERLGNTFTDEHSFVRYRNDYKRIRTISNNFTVKKDKKYGKLIDLSSSPPIIDIKLHQEQLLLSSLVGDKNNLHKIKGCSFQNYDVSKWDIEMINTAIEISLKWASK